MDSTRNPRLWSMARKHMWGQVYEPLVDDQWPHNSHFCGKYHEQPFSIIPNANTYGFLTNKWSPPEIQECDIWQGNISGVGCTSLWSMINGHTTYFCRRPHNPHFCPRNGLHQKSKNAIYGKQTYVGWCVRASSRWLMATQPPFFRKYHERPFSIIPKANTYGFLTKKWSL
jgi:hypothetical protein